MQPVVLRLLRHAASIADGVLARQPLQSGTKEFEWISGAGLGPLLLRFCPNACADALDALRTQDLRARVEHANRCSAAIEIIDVCDDLRVSLVLLKGISTSEQYYPSGHLRPMSDIDVLVPADKYEIVEQTLIKNGFLPHPNYVADEHAQHGVPLFCARWNVWLELHTRLFSNTSPPSAGTLFDPPHVWARTAPSTFEGRPVLRLADELQLIYLATGWVRDISASELHPSYLVPLFDATLLLHSVGTQLRWDVMLEWLDNEFASASLHLLLSYLARHGLFDVPTKVLSELSGRQRLLGTLEIRVIHHLLDDHLMRGTAITRLFQSWHIVANLMAPGRRTVKVLLLPWRIAFPPGRQERYEFRYQISRIGRWCQRLGR
jgi:hypothetical protein